MAKSNTPRLEDDPAFQERMADALGGSPSTPAQFQPITNGTSEPHGAMGELAAGAPQASGGLAARPKTIFDEEPSQAQHKARLDQIRSRMTGLVSAIAVKTESLDQALLNAGDDKEFVAYCKKHGFDAGKAAAFLTDIHNALDGITQ